MNKSINVCVTFKAMKTNIYPSVNKFIWISILAFDIISCLERNRVKFKHIHHHNSCLIRELLDY